MRREILIAVVGLALTRGLVGHCAMAAEHQGIEDEAYGPSASGGSVGPFPLPPGASVERDLAYGSDALQRLDVYHPANANRAPVMFMVHGGGWRHGLGKAVWGVVKNKVTHWVSKGYIFVSINYRAVPAADPLTQADDVAKALAFVQSRIRSWGGDPSRVVLMGHSAGAHLVALLTADPTIGARQGVAPWLVTVSLDSGAMDVEQIMRSRHLPLYDAAFKADPTYWRAASPTQRLAGRPAAPMLIVCSSRRLDSCPQGRAFAAKAEQAGGRVEVLPVDLGHGEVNGQLGLPGAYTDSVDRFLRSAGLP
jgi:arylformamidase